MVGKITQLGRQVEGYSNSSDPASEVIQEHRPLFSRGLKRTGLLGILLVLLSKFKLLLLGLFKLPTLLSMLLFFWVYTGRALRHD